MADWAQEESAACELVMNAARELYPLKNDHELLRFVVVLCNGKANSPEEVTVEREAAQRFWLRDDSYDASQGVKKSAIVLANLYVAMKKEIERLGGASPP